MKLGREWIGRKVDVTIDRPLGSAHPRYPDMIYPVNYGYIEGTRAADAEPVDAYVLGENKPLDAFCGEVIAIIHRQDDVEDKLVVAQNIMERDIIASLVEFQEKHFDSKVEI